MLESLTTSGYTTKDFFTFAEELQSFYSKLVMAVPSPETIYLCVEDLFKHRNIGLMLIICQKTLSLSYLLPPCLSH